MPAGEVSALLQLEVNAVLFTSLFRYSVSQETKKSVPRSSSCGWLVRPAGFLPADGAVVQAAKTTMVAEIVHKQHHPSVWLQSQLENSRGQRERGAWPFATHRTVYSETEGVYASHSTSVLPVSLVPVRWGAASASCASGTVCKPGPRPAGLLAWPLEAGNGCEATVSLWLS